MCMYGVCIITVLLYSTCVCMEYRGETIRVNSILRIAFECIAIYCHIAIVDRILVKRHFI